MSLFDDTRQDRDEFSRWHRRWMTFIAVFTVVFTVATCAGVFWIALMLVEKL